MLPGAFSPMRLDSIALAGYRSFAARSPAAPDRPLARLELAPLTIILGKNNSGKSSLARFSHHLLLAMGSEGPDPFPMKGRESFGDSFRDIQHDGSFFNPLDLEVEFTSGDGASGKLVSQLIQTGEFTENSAPVIQASVLNGAPNPALDKVKGLLPDVPGAAALRADARELLGRSCHLQPVRGAIRRWYSAVPGSPSMLPETSEAVAGMLYADGALRSAAGDWTFENLDGWRLDLRQTLDSLTLVGRRGKNESNLADSGQGIQQVLPVVVLCCWRRLAPERGPCLDIIEEPELHLHDAAHAPLGDLLLKAVDGTGNRILRDFVKIGRADTSPWDVKKPEVASLFADVSAADAEFLLKAHLKGTGESMTILRLEKHAQELTPDDFRARDQAGELEALIRLIEDEL